jgi:AraC family transcriptional regulator of adaptative response/methylated-DNA-[protein]-cysteine methyltransferase
MSDYERVATLIRHLEAHRGEQPGLGDLAEVAGLSPGHLQRLFTRWAGVSPKAFLQCLTLEHARGCLERGASVLDAALDAGLSGPGRLHDLTVKLEAASPGELKSGGAGWTLRAGHGTSPFGPCRVALSPRGVCHLAFLDAPSRSDGEAALRAEWPRASVVWDDGVAEEVLARVFSRGPLPQQAPLRAYVAGTPFQVTVWRALLRVPPGACVTYSGLAQALGKPRAARAVGAAVGRNRLGALVPCHRVIRASGALGGYRWGHERKRALLAWEGVAQASTSASS